MVHSQLSPSHPSHFPHPLHAYMCLTVGRDNRLADIQKFGYYSISTMLEQPVLCLCVLVINFGCPVVTEYRELRKFIVKNFITIFILFRSLSKPLFTYVNTRLTNYMVKEDLVSTRLLSFLL